MSEVIFNDADHSYTNKSGSRYTSATTIISKFKVPFDKVAVSKAYAKKNGGTAKQWQDKWKAISDAACEKGTNFHAKKENEILEANGIVREQIINPINIEYTPKRTSSLDFTHITDGVKTELVVYNHYFGIAGQVDYVKFDGEFFDLDDHKTNKKIDRWSYRHPTTGYKMMKAPLSHLMDTNFNHYALQLSLYAFMIEQLTDKKVRNLQFTHYPPDILEEDGISKEGVVYQVEYLKKEVLSMLHSITVKDISQFK